MNDLSISERLRPHKERIAKANAEWEALQQARQAADSTVVMRVEKQGNEISIKLTDRTGDSSREERAARRVIALLKTLGLEVKLDGEGEEAEQTTTY